MMRPLQQWAALALLATLLPAQSVSAFQASGRPKAAKPQARPAVSKSAAAEPGFDSQTCPYLTRPSVRKDGGGLNRHAPGSQVCHERQLMMCVNGRWQSRGPCSAYGKPKDAFDVEGSDPSQSNAERQQADTDEGESASSRLDKRSGSGDSQGKSIPGRAGAPALLGQSPLQQSIEQTREEIENTTREMSQRQGALHPRASGASGGSGSGRTRSGGATRAGSGAGADCASDRASLAYADDAIARVVSLMRSMSTTDDVSSPELTHLRKLREEVAERLASGKCN